MSDTSPLSSSADSASASTTPQSPLPAFSAYGVEIEYMIVDRENLNVRSIADQLLQAAAGKPAAEVTRGAIGWSNELVLHVLELKSAKPVPSLEDLPEAFHAEIGAVNTLLAPRGAQLMPGGMHPWMNPRMEARLWPHDNAAIYRSYDRIFDCRRHAWANLQSVHLNLPFAGDDEFARLHAAVRMVLPILPALAASSPWADGRFSGYMDYRLTVYRGHQSKVPASMDDCIPDPSTSPADYRERVFAPMFQQIAAYDDMLGEDAGVLSHEWLDAHAAVPRFGRSTIEIRLLDVQECPQADLAIAAATAALVQRLYHAPPTLPLDTAALVAIFDACVRDAERAVISDAHFLARLGVQKRSCTAGALWERLIETLFVEGLLAPQWLPPLQHILRLGTLARRLNVALDDDAANLHDVYQQLCQCLRDNRMFDPSQPKEPLYDA